MILEVKNLKIDHNDLVNNHYELRIAIMRHLVTQSNYLITFLEIITSEKERNVNIG